MATRTRLLALVALLALMVGTTTAQDARTAVQAAAKNIGADSLKTIQISGTGWNAAVGQSYSPTEDWPKFEVTSFTKTIDFDAKFSREQLTRRQGNYPPRAAAERRFRENNSRIPSSAGTMPGTCRGTMLSRS